MAYTKPYSDQEPEHLGPREMDSYARFPDGPPDYAPLLPQQMDGTGISQYHPGQSRYVSSVCL